MSVETTLNKPQGYKGTGKPTKLTPEVQAIICQYVADGNYLNTACLAAGVSDRVFYKWLERGKAEMEAGDEAGIHFQFVHAVKKAEAIAEAERVSRIAKAGEGGQVSKRRITTFKDGSQTIEESFSIGQWLADMTHLERRHPERWARPAPINQNQGGNTYHINIDKAIIDASEKFKAMIATISERTAAPLALPAIDKVEDETTNGNSITDSDF